MHEELMLSTSEKKAVVVQRTTPFDLLNKYHSKILVALVLIGVFLRLFHFFENRSLWIDELYLDGNLIRMSFWELATSPMDYQQKAPLGFLWAVKLAVLLFGKTEQPLRLFSFLCGLGSLFVFIPVTKYFLKPWTALIAIGILAMGEPFIYYGTEAKQYSAELFAAIVALYLFIRFEHSLKIAPLVLWGISGGILVWFSYSAIFLLVGIAIVVSLNLLFKREWKEFFLKLIPFTIWLVSFSFIYYFFLRKYQDSGWLKNFFEVCMAYMPLPPTSFQDIRWFPYTNYMLLERNLGLLAKYGNIKDYNTIQTFFRMPLLPLLLEGIGIIALFRKSKYRLFLLTLPILITLVASAFKLYPFYERLIQFLAPLFLILIAYGAERAGIALKNFKQGIVAPILFLLLLFPPIWNAVRFTVNSNKLMKREHNREALLYVNDRYRPGDIVYIYWSANHAYKYYKDAYNLKYTALGREDIRSLAANKEDYYNKILDQVGDIKGKKRLWVIASPNLKNNIGDYQNLKPKWYHEPNFSPAKALLNNFSRLGTIPVDSFIAGNTDVRIDVRLYTLTHE